MLRDAFSPRHKSSQKVRTLVSAGRSLTSMNFVTFALSSTDVLGRHIVPLCLLTEQNGVDAADVWRGAQKTFASLGQAISAMAELRRWVFIASLVGSYIKNKGDD